MTVIQRRMLLAAAATVAMASAPRKSRAEELGDMSDLVPVKPPQPPPAFTFTAADGTVHRLDEFQGHGMVLNLWATWCVPCVAELPSLDALSGELAPDDIAVLPLASDRGGAGVVERFYGEHHISRLPVLLDPKGAAARAWGVKGIPTTYIINKDGLEVARLEGGANWSGAADLIRRLAR
jgi:thiol-disulfide isomerase/thioredoxin